MRTKRKIWCVYALMALSVVGCGDESTVRRLIPETESAREARLLNLQHVHDAAGERWCGDAELGSDLVWFVLERGEYAWTYREPADAFSAYGRDNDGAVDRILERERAELCGTGNE